jgi:ABC-2 type transport system ATP-binding protein/lipopolysaccharide transport system ATP-binding protein
MASISLEQVSVDFPIFGANKNLRLSLLGGLTGGRILPQSLQTKSIVIKALDQINLECRSGDRIGLVGHNGAGKSTLLRVLAGVYQPTGGRISVVGKISSLLNQAPGIEPEDSGYENILTVGMLLGMSLDEIKEKAPEIIEFSGLGDFINFPLRTYSTGMQARLSFSICTAIDPSILLLDEGIGAADARFAEKANERIWSLLNKTEILVLASHSDEMIKEMCNRAVLMHHGKILEIGNVSNVLRNYHDLLKTTD